MDKLLIKGGTSLKGKVKITGSKNATLPILAACLLTEEPCVIHEVPLLQDIKTMLGLLSSLGADVTFNKNKVTICSGNQLSLEAPYDIVSKMRASIYVLGPLLARFHKVKVYFPGGCAIGPRPIDLHIKGMESLGAEVKVEHGYIDAKTSVLKGTNILLEGTSGPSVGATANVMMAATLANGTTNIIGAALEREIVDLANFLIALGAKIDGAGSSTIKITGIKKLKGSEWTPISDRIEAGSFACAAAITHGKIEIDNCNPEHLGAVNLTLRSIGCNISETKNKLTINAESDLMPTSIITAPYPGFPTDLQAQFMSVLSVADGTSMITENIFKNRFLHALELNRMGAQIKVEDNVAVIDGIKKLSGAQVMASDLRASVALVIAGLAAQGETVVSRIYHLDRGYERIEEKLHSLGAVVKRVSGK